MSQTKISDADRAAALEARLVEVSSQRNLALDAAATATAAAKIQGRRCEALEKQLSEANGQIAELQQKLAAAGPAGGA